MSASQDYITTKSSYRLGSLRDCLLRRWMDDRQYAMFIASELLKVAGLDVRCRHRGWRLPSQPVVKPMALMGYYSTIGNSGACISFPNQHSLLLVYNPTSNGPRRIPAHIVFEVRDQDSEMVQLSNEGGFCEMDVSSRSPRNVRFALGNLDRTDTKALVSIIQQVALLPSMDETSVK